MIYKIIAIGGTDKNGTILQSTELMDFGLNWSKGPGNIALKYLKA